MSEPRYWQILLDEWLDAGGGRPLAVDRDRLGALIDERFRAEATPQICKRLRVPLADDGRPDASVLRPELFGPRLPSLAGRLLLTYLEAVRDVFAAELDLGEASADADEWQVGGINVYPEHGPYLAVLAEDLHDALAPFGPTSGRFWDESGTIAGQVRVALTDDLGHTLSAPAYRSESFDPHRFSRLMATRFVNSEAFETLTSIASTLQSIISRAEGKEAPLPWMERPPRAEEGEPRFAPISAPSLLETPGDEPSPAAASGDAEPEPGEAEPPGEPAPKRPAAGDLGDFLGRLFQGAPPRGGDDET